MKHSIHERYAAAKEFETAILRAIGLENTPVRRLEIVIDPKKYVWPQITALLNPNGDGVKSVNLPYVADVITDEQPLPAPMIVDYVETREHDYPDVRIGTIFRLSQYDLPDEVKVGDLVEVNGYAFRIMSPPIDDAGIMWFAYRPLESK